MVTNKVDELYVNLKKIPDFIKLLGESEIFPIYKEEVLHLLKNSDKHLIEMSKGIIKGDQVIIEIEPF